MTIEISTKEILAQAPRFWDWSLVRTEEASMTAHDKARHWYEMGYRWFRVFDTTLKGWETFAYKDIPNSLTVIDVFPVSVPSPIPRMPRKISLDQTVEYGKTPFRKWRITMERLWASKATFEAMQEATDALYLHRFFEYGSFNGRWYATKPPEDYVGEFAINPIAFIVSSGEWNMRLCAQEELPVRLHRYRDATMLWPSGEYTDKTLT